MVVRQRGQRNRRGRRDRAEARPIGLRPPRSPSPAVEAPSPSPIGLPPQPSVSPLLHSSVPSPAMSENDEDFLSSLPPLPTPAAQPLPSLHELAPPPLHTGITGSLHSSFNLAPPTLLVPPTVSKKRSHRRVSPEGEAIQRSVAYSTVISQMQKNAAEELQAAAVNGELTLDPNLTETELDTMVVDAQLLEEKIGKLKTELSVKITRYEKLQAQIKVGKRMLKERSKRQKTERLAALRAERETMQRQQSEEVAAARPAPPTDLTTQGIEPNP